MDMSLITILRIRYLTAIALCIVLEQSPADRQTFTSSPSKIAGGNSLWVENGGDASDATVRVDVGTIHRIRDELEVHWSQLLNGSALRISQRRFPKIDIPEGSTKLDTVRIVCGNHGIITSLVEREIVSPRGETLAQFTSNPVAQREQQERSKLRLEYPFNYGRNPSAMVCWAVARKCSGDDFVWPPPALNAGSSAQEKDDYVRQFIPPCNL